MSARRSEVRCAGRRLKCESLREVPFVLSLCGIVVATVGVVLLYVFHDPTYGHGLMLETSNTRREKVGARSGLLLVVLSAALQVAAVIVASQ
jgi:hypothetical protein